MFTFTVYLLPSDLLNVNLRQRRCLRYVVDFIVVNQTLVPQSPLRVEDFDCNSSTERLGRKTEEGFTELNTMENEVVVKGNRQVSVESTPVTPFRVAGTSIGLRKRTNRY